MGINMSNISLSDFNIWSEFELDSESGCFWDDDTPLYILDKVTSKQYWNEDTWVIRTKCFLLILGSPLVHLIIGPISNYFKEDTESTQALFLTILSPLSMALLTFAAVYGLFLPHNGRKLYASLERLLYDDPLLAPCFQPNPESHLCGGDMKTKNAF